VPMRYGLPEEEFGVLPQGYFRRREASRLDGASSLTLQSLEGSVVEVEATSAAVWADLVDFDYSRMHRHHPMMGWYPGDAIAPLVLASEGSGRCVYFAGELDRDAGEVGLAGTMRSLSDAARWVLRDGPTVEVDCPTTVEVAFHRAASGGSLVALLVNHETNQLSPRYVVREVRTVSNIVMRLAGVGRVKRAWSLRGGEVSLRRADGQTEVVLPGLAETDAVAMEWE
jgi:hypothetical protein